MSRATHFEIPVDNPDRAEKFYADVFGWTFQRFEGAPGYYGLATTGPDDQAGINGALFARGDRGVVTLTMETDSIEESIKKVEAAGGKVLNGKMPVPGVGYTAVCVDTEGNPFGIFKDDESATM